MGGIVRKALRIRPAGILEGKLDRAVRRRFSASRGISKMTSAAIQHGRRIPRIYVQPGQGLLEASFQFEERPV
jgi:hypothetical protein